MLVMMTINEAVQFLQEHVSALECSQEESFFVETYDIKMICAVNALISCAGHLERINPKLIERTVSYELEKVR